MNKFNLMQSSFFYITHPVKKSPTTILQPKTSIKQLKINIINRYTFY